MPKPAKKRTGQHSGRSRLREPVALALAAGKTLRAVAEEHGIAERTIQNWLADPAFIARLREIRAEMFGLAVGKLADLSGKAADVLGGLLDSPSEVVQRQAAVNVLELGSKLREQADLAAEVADLKRIVEGDNDAVSDATARDSGPANGRSGPGAESPGDAGGPAG